MKNSDQIFGNLPGAQPLDPQMIEEFSVVRTNLGKDYKPRTRHLRPDHWAKFTNRLFLEKSPYLLQHAHNPVNWFAWGAEAFLTARRLRLPILLSIGYSTCHWCHVMEEESFEDEAIAHYLNENYVAIKVDREERPDIDGIYMSAVQALTGHGGWPLTLWLTPDQEPFFGGTYFPPRDGDRGSSTGFLSLLRQLKNIYDQEPERVIGSAKKISAMLKRSRQSDASATRPLQSALDGASRYYKSRFDDVFGGLRGAPKFPSTLPIRWLLREHLRSGDGELLHMATLSLKKMAGGGIYDHVGGGFHRYATDERWLIPHFEKMLYDNALLATAYLEAFMASGDTDFKRITKEILFFIEREMTSAEGAFFSAIDADSLDDHGHIHEGFFFTWTPAEIDEALDPKTSLALKAYYGVHESGNFEYGRSILHTVADAAHLALELKISEAELFSRVEKGKDLLYKRRLARAHPLQDEKILTAWNGLMISAFARAGLGFFALNYVEQAARAADFILKNLKQDQKLYRSFKDNKASHIAFLEDYAFFIAALLDLYEASSDLRWLKEAIELDRILKSDYEDEKEGGFFMSGQHNEKLIAREKPHYDGAEPSGNSVALLNLLRLNEFTHQDEYRKRAEKVLQAFGEELSSYPMSLSEMLIAIDFLQAKPKEIVIVTPVGKLEDARPFLDELHRHFVPHRTLVVVSEGSMLKEHAQIIPWISDKVLQNGQTTAYVCEKGLCQIPTTDPKIFRKQL